MEIGIVVLTRSGKPKLFKSLEGKSYLVQAGDVVTFLFSVEVG